MSSYKRNGREISRDVAFEEFVADSMETMLADGEVLAKLKAKDQTLWETIKNYITTLIAKIKKVYEGLSPDSAEGRYVAEWLKTSEEIRDKWVEALEGTRGVETKNETAEVKESAREENQDITLQSVEALREILKAHGIKGNERLSINQFTSEDIKKAEPWARKFYAELGTKSPFFRAWFGDWRGYDRSKIKTVTVENIDLADVVMQNGDYGNADTGWTIHAGKTLREETKHYARGEKVSVKALNDVKNILENAVLLDTEISTPNSKNKKIGTAFMHKLYAPITYQGKQYIAKLTVEEYFDEGSDSVKRKGYHLAAIKIEAAGGHFTENSADMSRSGTASIDSIADLHELVKTYDKDFSPKDVNPVLLNEDGTPKVFYHQTESDFSIFNTEKESAGKYDSDLPTGIFFKSSNRDIGLKGKKQMPVYLHAVNPLTFVSRDAAVSYWRKNVDGYADAVDSVKEVDAKYKKLFDEESKREKEEYMRLWKERQAGNISEEEYQNAVSRDKLEEILDKWTSAADEARRDGKELLNSYITSSEYDGLIIQNDQGSFGRSTDAYIVFDSTQIKSATDNIGTFDGGNPDILYSDRYSYEELVSRPDMQVTTLPSDIPKNRADIVSQAKKNAAKVGKFNTKDGSVSVYVDDIGKNVVLGTNGLRHGLDRRLNINAPVVLRAGEILKNSIRINELNPREENISKTYVLIGMSKDANNTPYPVTFVVNSYTNEIMSMDVLYSMATKKEPTRLNDAGVPEKSDYLIGSDISIAQLLEFVNTYFPDVLPESVLRH